MGTMVVSASKGVLSPLLSKLTTLMGDEFKKLKGVRKQVSFLKDELSSMNAFLETLDLMDELDPLAKDWRSHVREMAYDIEDCIDDFMHHLGDADPKQGFISETMRRLKAIRHRHRIAHKIDELKTRVLEASRRRARYMLDEHSSDPGFVAVDPRVCALYTEATNLVGIDGPREELVKWLIDPQQELKVVSVVGFGGLGKTTLVKDVYVNIIEQFQCMAFVYVSQRPDTTRLLNGIRSKLGIQLSSPTSEVQDDIAVIREYLKDRRVHDMMLDLILSRCEEDNFIVVVRNFEETAGRHDKMVRRISLSFNMDRFSNDSTIDSDIYDSDIPEHTIAVDAKIPGTFSNSLSKVRSVAMFGKSKCIPLLLCKYLRVLIIDINFPWGWRQGNFKLDLTDITQLSQLKYLKITVENAKQIQLPNKIQGLRHLETLEIKGCDVNIPSDIMYLHHLSHLIVPWWCPVDGLDNMKSLHTLQGLILNGDPKIWCLGEMGGLKNLGLLVKYPGIIDNLKIDAIVSSLGKLRNLRYLECHNMGDWIYDKNDKLGSLSNPLIHLEQLVLTGWELPRFPINGDLKNLRHLNLNVEETSTEEVRVLGELPSLVGLTLSMLDKPWWRRHRPMIVFGMGYFPALEELDIHYGDDATSLIRFEAPGVLPNIRTLTLRLWARDWGGAAPAGMEHLVKLQHIYLEEHHWYGSSSDSGIECFFKNYVTQVHPSHPSISIRWKGHRWRRVVEV